MARVCGREPSTGDPCPLWDSCAYRLGEPPHTRCSEWEKLCDKACAELMEAIFGGMPGWEKP